MPYATYLYLDFHFLFHDKAKRTQVGNLLAQDVLDDLVQDVLARGHCAHVHLNFDQVEQHAHISILVQGRPIIILEIVKRLRKSQGPSI